MDKQIAVKGSDTCWMRPGFWPLRSDWLKVGGGGVQDAVLDLGVGGLGQVSLWKNEQAWAWRHIRVRAVREEGTNPYS